VRIAVNLQPAPRQIEEPGFANSVSRIQRKLHIAVVVNRRVRHFDEEQDIGGARQGLAILVRPRREERYVRLRFAIGGKNHWILGR
jgi:hypothetical protein